MTLVGVFVVGCATVAAAYQLFQLFAVWWFLRRGTRAADAASSDVDLPPVTVLKPLKGPPIVTVAPPAVTPSGADWKSTTWWPGSFEPLMSISRAEPETVTPNGFCNDTLPTVAESA